MSVFCTTEVTDSARGATHAVVAACDVFDVAPIVQQRGFHVAQPVSMGNVLNVKKDVSRKTSREINGLIQCASLYGSMSTRRTRAREFDCQSTSNKTASMRSVIAYRDHSANPSSQTTKQHQQLLITEETEEEGGNGYAREKERHGDETLFWAILKIN